MSKVIEKRVVSDELAVQILEAAAAHAARLGVSCAIAVVDESGQLKAFRRLDGAPLGTVQLAPGKARMAASFGAPSSAFHTMATADVSLAVSLAGLPGVTLLGGGEPITVAGDFVGAVGVSGGSEEQDIEIAKAGLSVATA